MACTTPNTIPNDRDALLRRAAGAEALTAAGYPIREATLATKASRGGGPPFRRFGRVPLYRWGDLLDWAQSRMGPVMCSTSELDAATNRGLPGEPNEHLNVPAHDRGRPSGRRDRHCHPDLAEDAGSAATAPMRPSAP